MVSSRFPPKKLSDFVLMRRSEINIALCSGGGERAGEGEGGHCFRFPAETWICSFVFFSYLCTSLYQEVIERNTALTLKFPFFKIQVELLIIPEFIRISCVITSVRLLCESRTMKTFPYNQVTQVHICGLCPSELNR